ncbi:uncharacterized protein TNCV_3378771 [Trichonephila clavipes]|nr:uncharacterized protein TNCV_3378771 [Trichonephila clavipes]
MSWTYRWAVMVPRINTKDGCLLWAMTPHTITPAVGAVYRCKAKAGLRRSPRGWRRWMGVKGSTHNGRRDPKCLSAKRHHMVREDTWAPSEGATFAWMAPMKKLLYACISYDVTVFSTTGLSRAF